MTELSTPATAPLQAIPDTECVRYANASGWTATCGCRPSARAASRPQRDDTYRFDPDTTMAILAGFANRRVMIQGYHGTGKSTHIEQVAARLNWPCVRCGNLDSHVSRIDLIGKDAIVLREGKQVTEFREGILPWALQHACALVFDEYDAGRPDVCS